MSRTFNVILVLCALALLWCTRVVWDYFDLDSPANAAMQVQLKLFGGAMYEYHSKTGRWPTKLDDLAETSLPERSYVWRQTAKTIVLLWPQNLKPEPKDNANVLLAYWNGGLYTRLGRVWVCWGDLRTQRVSKTDVRVRAFLTMTNLLRTSALSQSGPATAQSIPRCCSLASTASSSLLDTPSFP